MRAIEYDGSRVHVAERRSPRLAENEVLVRPSFTGICGTDVHVSHGLHPRVRPPVILGHEFAGKIYASAAHGWAEGQRVAVEPLRTCGVCRACRGDMYNQCQQLQILGVDIDGSLAELVAVPANRLVEIPDEVSLEAASLLEPLAVSTHAVARLGELEPDRPVLIFGGGPIGWLSAQILALRGLEAHVIEANDHRRSMVEGLGHKLVSLKDVTERDYQGAIEASGTDIGFQTLIGALGTAGILAAVGLPKGPGTIDVMRVISKELDVRGSRVYTRTDFEAALTMLKSDPARFTPLITHVIDADDVVESGLRVIEAGGPVGKILVREVQP